MNISVVYPQTTAGKAVLEEKVNEFKAELLIAGVERINGSAKQKKDVLNKILNFYKIEEVQY